MRKIQLFWLISATISMLSCASGPKVPEWVQKNPEPDTKYTYFVGSSSANDSATALNDATASIIAGIMQYMGVSITVSSNAEAKASLDEYRAQITQTVKTESKGHLSGFEVVEKYIQKDSKTGQYTVHVLARYETKELLSEKSRMESLFREKTDAVTIPEQKGDTAAQEGRVIDAIRAYAEAMTAAAISDIENARIKLERNAKKASSLAISLKLSGVSSSQGLDIVVGGQIPPLSVRLTTNSGGVERSVPGAPLVISYPRKLASGRTGTATTQAFTDQNGNATFSVPAIDMVGNFRVTVGIDAESIRELLAGLPAWAMSYSDAINSDLLGTVSYINYKVISAAKNKPIAIAAYIKASSLENKPDVNVFVSSLKEALIKEGFVVFDATMPGLGTGEKPDIEQLRASAPSGVLRFALATLEIGPPVKDGDYFIETATGSLSVLELSTGGTLYSAAKSAQGVGLSETVATSNALKTLGGQVFAKDLLSSLP